MKIPKLYILAIIVVASLGIFISCVWFGVITLSDLQYLYALLSTFILGWIVVILFAIIGAIFIGMYLSHRILLSKDFTPFEKGMLEMKEDMAEIKSALKRIEGKIKL